MKRNIRLRMTAHINGIAQDPVQASGYLLKKQDKFLIVFTDSEQVKTTVKLETGRAHILRSCAFYSTGFPVIPGKTTTGAMGENAFSVDGKQLKWTVQPEGGSVQMEYILPDLSDAPAQFQIQIVFHF